MSVRVQQEKFDYGAEAQGFADSVSGAGAVVSFAGIVRESDDGGLDRMVIEHYPGMTERALNDIREEAMQRWSLAGAMILHRFGTLRPGESIMMVATAARHRGDAFAAAEFLMDYLKSRAPFWKREITRNGSAWVEARDADEQALARWQT